MYVFKHKYVMGFGHISCLSMENLHPYHLKIDWAHNSKNLDKLQIGDGIWDDSAVAFLYILSHV